jgi:ubiquitin-activating enzyme E1
MLLHAAAHFCHLPHSTCSSKSTVAADAAVKLNPRLAINPLQNRVSPETEDVFNDGFWEGLDIVVNALDNVNARLYVDSR